MDKNYTATIRLIDEDKDELFRLMAKVAVPFLEHGLAVKPTVFIRELIVAQISNIKKQGGTTFHRIGSEKIKVEF